MKMLIMKRTFTILTLLLAGGMLTAQTFQATILPGSRPNSVKAVIKPNANVSGQLTSMQLTFIIRSSISPKPAPAILTNFVTGMSYQFNQSTETAGGNTYYVFNYDGVGGSTVPAINYTANTEYTILEVVFNNGPSPATNDVGLAQLPNGGTGGDAPGQYNFFVSLGGVERVNLAAQFYGPGATNDGQNYAGFSFAVAPNISLPTKFLSFLALKQREEAKLTWSIDNEEGNDHFDIERSTDGHTFNKVAQVAALNNGRTSNSYDITDSKLGNLNAKNIYYRIRQVDYSGKALYSEIRKVQLDGRDFRIGLYPNPASNSSRLVFDAQKAGNGFVFIRDAQGKQVQAINHQWTKGINQLVLYVAALAAGEYNVTIEGQDIHQSIKLRKL